jgi:hypothetical protein
MKDAMQYVSMNSEIDTVKDYVTKAQASYSQSKDSAMETIGQLYLLWRMVRSPVSSKDGRKWFKEEADVRNTAIDKHNDPINKILAKVKKYETGKLDPEVEYATKGKAAEDAQSVKDEEALFWKYAELKGRARYYGKQVKLNLDVEAFEFTSIVRFGLNLFDAVYNDVVSRYATVLRHVAKTMEVALVSEASYVVDFLRHQGGFEVVLKKASDLTGADRDSEDDEEVIEKDAEQFARDAVKGLTGKAVIEMESRFAKEGYVLMVGRSHSGMIEVLGEAPMTENDIKRAVLHLGNEAQIPDNDNSEFFARVVGISQIIRDGQPSGATRDNTQSGEKVKVEKTMVIREQADGQRWIVVSNRNAESSIVIHARPKDWAEFDLINRDVILDPKNMPRLVKDLSSLAKRRRIEYSFVNRPPNDKGEIDGSPVSLEARYEALVEAGRNSATKQFFWSRLEKVTHKPLDVDHFGAQFVAEIDHTVIGELLEGPYDDWEGKQAGNKAKRTTSFLFDDQELTVRVTPEPDHAIKLRQSVGGAFTMTFNQKDVFDLLKLLSDQKASKFLIEGDEAGLMAISWEDRLGTYYIFLPTVTKSGGLETRRVAPMRVIAQAQKAAE